MVFRVFSLLVLMIFFTSCDKFSFSKKEKLQQLDTIVDFTSVDLSPSFKACDSIIDKIKKANCFTKTMHQKIGKELQKHTLTVKDSIDETILMHLLINSKGEVLLEEVVLSTNVKAQLPKLDSILKDCVDKIPVIYPAIKRGIPVTTKYRLPIKISL